MAEIIDERQKEERFTQLLKIIGNGFLEYIALTEYCLGIEPIAPQNNNKEENKNNTNNSIDLENNILNIQLISSKTSENYLILEQHLLLQNLKHYKINYSRMNKLSRNYSELRLKMEKELTKSTVNDNFPSSSSSYPNKYNNNFKLFSRFCKCPSPQKQQKLYSKQFVSSSSFELQKIGISNNTDKFEKKKSDKTQLFTGIKKSLSLFDLTNNKQIEQGIEDSTTKQSSIRTIKAEMSSIENETCGMLGRLQFNVQAIIGFARICTGDVFEVSIRHGHQRWRTRGKTQPDKSQRWNQQPPIISLQILWNVPIQVKVLEIGFLRANCLSERQFDPAKFVSSQPQLVTMNLNNSGSLKLRLIVTWLPLISSSKIPSSNNLTQQKHFVQLKENVGFNSLNQQNNVLQRPEPQQRGKIRQHQSQVIIPSTNNLNQQNGTSIWRTTSSNSPSSFNSQVNKTAKLWHNNNNNNISQTQQQTTTNINQEQTNKTNDTYSPSDQSTSPAVSSSTAVENAQVPKVCLRDKKRQREQRLKLGASVGAALGGGSIGLRRESSKTEKDRWRCSSTTLLDEVYKDLSKSIPTIDDLSALHSSKPSSICGGSLGHSKSDFRGPSSSSSASEGHGARSGAKRIFSFVKRNEKSSLDKTTASDWRKSVSLAQIPQSRKSIEIEDNYLNNSDNLKQNQLDNEEPEEPEEPEQFNEKDEHRERTNSQKSLLQSPELQRQNNLIKKEISDFESALQTVDALLDMIECLRIYLTKLRPSEFTELVSFEAAMLNWEACLKLNRSSILCQLDKLLGKTTENLNKFHQNSIQMKKHKQRLAKEGTTNSSTKLLFSSKENKNNNQHSPSTASDHTEDDSCCVAGTSSTTTNIRYEQRQHILDHISENDSGIDSLRQYQSPYNSYASSARRLQQNNETNGLISSQLKERRKSIVNSTILNDEIQNEIQKNTKGKIITATGSAQMDACLAIHLDEARQPLEIISQVQGSPFEYTMTKMLYKMEGVETIALESMLGLLQDTLAQCQPNPQNVLLQLGLQFQLQQCWLSACKSEQEFLLVSASILRDKLRPICEPIIRNHYPKLVEKVLDSLFSLIIDSPISRKKLSNNQQQLPITLFQFVSIFRGKQFSAFIENLSHEAWITANLQSGLPTSIRDVMGRLRNVPVVPPLESLRHIGLVLAEQHSELYSPIEKYLRKASPELSIDLSACFMCLLEHENEASRRGACRALAILGAENSLICLDFLSKSDSSKSVRIEAEQASLRIRRLNLLKEEQKQIVTKI